MGRRGGPLDWSKADGMWLTCTNAEIARVVGCTINSVSTRRKVRNLGEVVQTKRTVQKDIPPDLGVETDYNIALREGVTITAVRNWRKTRGIPHPKTDHARIAKARSAQRETTKALRNALDSKIPASRGVPRTRANDPYISISIAIHEETMSLVEALTEKSPGCKRTDIIRLAIDIGLKELVRSHQRRGL